MSSGDKGSISASKRHIQDINDKKLEELRNKSKREMGEVEEQIPEQVKKLIELIAKENPQMILHPPTFDVYVRCLRAKKYDLPRAAKLYQKFCLIRHGSIGEVLNHCTPTNQYIPLYERGFSATLKFRDDLGRQVIVVRIENWDLKEATFEQTLASLALMIDEVTASEDTQLQGIVMVGDCKGLTFSHVKSISVAKIQGMFSIIQDSYPSRFKEFHIINNPFVFNMLYSIAKPFMKEKMKKRLLVHGHNTDSFHKSIKIEASRLPKCLGGSVPNEEYADMTVVDRIMQKDDHYKEFLKYGH